MPAETQSLEMFDMPTGGAWHEGLNRTYAAKDMEKLVSSLCSREIMQGRASHELH